jgi:hypothetical protein
MSFEANDVARAVVSEAHGVLLVFDGTDATSQFRDIKAIHNYKRGSMGAAELRAVIFPGEQSTTDRIKQTLETDLPVSEITGLSSGLPGNVQELIAQVVNEVAEEAGASGSDDEDGGSSNAKEILHTLLFAAAKVVSGIREITAHTPDFSGLVRLDNCNPVALLPTDRKGMGLARACAQMSLISAMLGRRTSFSDSDDESQDGGDRASREETMLRQQPETDKDHSASASDSESSEPDSSPPRSVVADGADEADDE